MQFILATNNANKARELRAFFTWPKEQEADGKGSIEFITPADLGLSFTPGEDGGTFTANATQKAVETAAFLASRREACEKISRVLPPGARFAVLSDDSGLCIDAMGGLPGVDSALFLGADTPYDVRNAHILHTLKHVPEDKRRARFVCIAACCMPDGHVLTAEGVLEGTIAHTAQGAQGFGYDPIFIPSGSAGRTLAEYTLEEKNAISHRGQAMTRMKALLEAEAAL